MSAQTSMSTAARISKTICGVIREWTAAGWIMGVDDVGRGLCEDFAQEIVEMVLAAEPGAAITIAETDDWWAGETDDAGRPTGRIDAFVADVARLRSEGAPLPTDLSDGLLANLIGGATHAWVVHDGRHYDATAPDGADHFLLMPFFARQIDAARNLVGDRTD